MITRKAETKDALNLAELVNMAGDGMPFYLWSKMADPGDDIWEVGRTRAMRDTGAFSYRNAFVLVSRGNVQASLLGYGLADKPNPDVYRDMPAMFVPLQELEDQVSGSWYINVIATYPDFRGRGAATSLLKLAEQLAIEDGKDTLSLIVSNASREALRLYTGLGFEQVDKREMVKEDWQTEGTQWLLMTRSLVSRVKGSQ